MATLVMVESIWVGHLIRVWLYVCVRIVLVRVYSLVCLVVVLVVAQVGCCWRVFALKCCVLALYGDRAGLSVLCRYGCV